MFPGPGAEIIRNEVGEPLGWDYPAQFTPGDAYGDPTWVEARAEEEAEGAEGAGARDAWTGLEGDLERGETVAYVDGYVEALWEIGSAAALGGCYYTVACRALIAHLSAADGHVRLAGVFPGPEYLR
jgi:hypothetical protein